MRNKKLLIGIFMFLIFVSFVSGVSWFDYIFNDYSEKFGADNVSVINDYQFAYFYEGNVTKYNTAIVEVFDSNLNITYNITNTTPYSVHVYRCMIVEFNNSKPYDYSEKLGNEVIII